MGMNVRLVYVSQFFRQLRLIICHKPSKEHIIFDVLSRLASTNVDPFIDGFASHLELDVLFTYFTTLAEISPNLLQKIIKSYKADN